MPDYHGKNLVVIEQEGRRPLEHPYFAKTASLLRRRLNRKDAS
jgi:hypothetical protein